MLDFGKAFVCLILAVAHVRALHLREKRSENSSEGRIRSIPLLRKRVKEALREEEYGDWAEAQARALLAKYSNDGTRERRATGTSWIVNQKTDSAYYTSIGVGTPPTAYNVILDTGSSDLWVAGPSCSTGCSEEIPRFDWNSSTTFSLASPVFQVQYGSAIATGIVGRDVVEMAGFQVPDQVVAVIDRVTPGLLSPPVSGLMGLGFQGIAASRGTPFWERLANDGVLDKPMMSFALTRFLGTDGATDEEPGGIFIMGGLNDSLYSGEIEYLSMPIATGTYWELPVTNLTINGDAVTLPASPQSNAAIDTGTTLIGAPAAVVDEIASTIPGSYSGQGQYANYFFYPCNTSVSSAISFGGRTWAIAPRDFQLLHYQNGTCLSSFFRLSMSANSPKWIIGDTFLKNVYSVFRYDPPSIGFADLSEAALDLNDINNPLPSPSLGATIIVASAGSKSHGSLSTFSCITISIALSIMTLYY